ncbi:TlpA disulfide reductase family protein [uncultured Chitinophaga sp.]|uniref:TlpA family protein disulfide reductase n=1 Tax=uncultured Chitinophaga sp. TaxID=339340 RepID=UPI0025FEFDA5|nr:TlpA disulfide reductase family protein [uncultured Chitinophaga sp.]
MHRYCLFLCCFLLGIIFFVNIEISRAQTSDKIYSRIEVGKPCPDFVLKKLYYGKRNETQLSDFSGRWLVLDFWGEFCGFCISGFPRMDRLKRKFDGLVEFLLIGTPHKEDSSIHAMYMQFKRDFDLSIPVAYDRTLFQRFWGDGAMPLIVVVDPNGIIRAITREIDAELLEEFVAGGNPKWKRIYGTDSNQNYDYSLPLLVKGNGGNDTGFLYRTVFTKWNDMQPVMSVRLSTHRFEILGADLTFLYKLAFFGKGFWGSADSSLYSNCYPNIILETKDSSKFTMNRISGDNMFCYSISNKIQKIASGKDPYNLIDDKLLSGRMKNDLENFFPYTAELEERDMPCYFLVAERSIVERLRTKGGAGSWTEPYGHNKGFLLKNMPSGMIIPSLETAFAKSVDLPIFDNTGIECNIDIDLRGLSFDERIKELNENGIQLILAVKRFKVLVIRDYTNK